MPVQRCTSDGKPGWRCGQAGKCYVYPSGDDAAELRAKKRAIAQCIAIGETPSADVVTAAADRAPAVDAAHFNSVATRAMARAVKLEKELAKVLEPILLKYGGRAARNFAKLSTETVTAAATVEETVALVEQRQDELAAALKTTDYDEIRRAKARLKYAQDKLAEMSGSLPPPTWTTPSPDRLLNVEALTAEIKKKTQPVVLAFAEKVITDMTGSPPLTAAATRPMGVNWETSNPLVGKALQDTAAQVANIAETTRGDVMKAIRESYDAGLSIPNTADAIRRSMEEATPARATLIARTEMIRTVNAASLAGVDLVDNATGQQHFKVWLTAAGAKHPRHETYVGLNGQTKPKEATFDVGGHALMYPGDPAGPAHETCNCRCALAYSEQIDNDLAAPPGDFTTEGLIGPPRPGAYAEFDTNLKYRVGNQPDAPFTKERQILHGRILNHYLEGAAYAENPEAVFLAGGSGAGKSSLQIPFPARNVRIDPDAIKEFLPEYKLLAEEGRAEEAAMLVHEESSYLAKELQKEAVRRRYNVVVDGTGNNPDIGSFLGKMMMPKQAGYRVRVELVDIPTKEAIRRADQRFNDLLREGKVPRKVDERTIRQIHRDVALQFRRSWKDSDEINYWRLWDTSGPLDAPPVLVAEKHAGAPIRVFDQKRYDAVLKKADEKLPLAEKLPKPAAPEFGAEPAANPFVAELRAIAAQADESVRDTATWASMRQQEKYADFVEEYIDEPGVNNWVTITRSDDSFVSGAAYVVRQGRVGYDVIEDIEAERVDDFMALIEAAGADAADNSHLLSVHLPTAAGIAARLEKLGFTRDGEYWLADEDALNQLLGRAVPYRSRVEDHFLHWDRELNKITFDGKHVAAQTRSAAAQTDKLFIHYGDDVKKIALDINNELPSAFGSPLGAYNGERIALWTKKIMERGGDAFGTFLHEFGHYIDQHHFPNWAAGRTLTGVSAETYRSAVGTQEMRAWEQAVRGSATWQKWNRIRRLKHEVGDEQSVAYLHYLMSPEEMWARSYRQYVLIRLEEESHLHPDLFTPQDRADIAGALTRLRAQQVFEADPDTVSDGTWSDLDFVPIRKAMDELFAKLGWLRVLS